MVYTANHEERRWVPEPITVDQVSLGREEKKSQGYQVLGWDGWRNNPRLGTMVHG